MDTLNVTLWFNEETPKSVDFVTAFKDDLKKCFARFGQELNISLNPKSFGEGKIIIVLSSDDSSSSTFIAKCNSVISNPNAKFLLIEPFESKQISFSQYAQPTLFWDKLYATDEIRLFRRDILESQAQYWEKVIDLVVELSTNQIANETVAKREKVYLSQDIISYNAEIENLKRDLNDLGYDVVPDTVLSNSFDECTNQVNNSLNSVRLIIHFIPPIYNTFFINQHLSLAEHQCNLSADYVERASTKPHRIIWIPSAYEITDEENQVFVEKIQRDEKQTRNTMILKSSIEDLKKYYRKILRGEGQLDKNLSETTDVYIVTDSNLTGQYLNLKKSFEANNLSVCDNYSGITYSQHLSMLAKAKIVVVCYSINNEQWLRVKVNDIQKSKGLESFNPFEKLLLLKVDKNLDVKDYEGLFNRVLDDAKELSSI